MISMATAPIKVRHYNLCLFKISRWKRLFARCALGKSTAHSLGDDVALTAAAVVGIDEHAHCEVLEHTRASGFRFWVRQPALLPQPTLGTGLCFELV